MTSRPQHPSRPAPWAVTVTVALLGLAPGSLGCAPIVRPAPFEGARTQVTDTSLLGPFDGQIVDSTTGEPLQDAVVVGVWSYDRGDGFIGPHGSESVSVQTDSAGRYRIRRAPTRVRGTTVRLVSFHLVVYKRGYASYRSESLMLGGTRRDFTGRHNRIAMDKWRERDSHADHLLFLAPPREVRRVAGWEERDANLDLYRALGGSTGESAGLQPEGGGQAGGEAPSKLEDLWLEATEVMLPEDVAMRTGFDGEFVVEDLGDFPRSHFYHGVLYRAEGLEQEYDFSFRVWHEPPGGLDPVVQIFKDNLPVEPSAEVTPETWVYEEPGTQFRGVGFIDRETETGVLVSCGPAQCIDVETAIILAKYISGRLDKLERLPAVAEASEGEPADGQPSEAGEPREPEADPAESSDAPDSDSDSEAGASETGASGSEEPTP